MKNKQIILFMSDTTRKDMLGIYNPEMYTPNIDQLAKDGLVFNNAYSCQPVCGPARSAIFTGQFPHTNGMIANGMSFGQNILTVGQRLTRENIHCGYVGKYHLDGGDYFGYGKSPDGWDEKYWYDQKNYLDSLESDELRKKSRKKDSSFDPGFDISKTFAQRVSNKALEFLEDNIDTNFFLTVSYDEPHPPFICPAPYNTMYEDYSFPDYPNYGDDLTDKPFLQQLWGKDYLDYSNQQLRKAKPLFLGANSFMDAELGRVMEKINQDFPEAIVIYTSDHGDMCGSHHLYGKDSAAYKEIANIPLIIRGGDKGTTDSMASHIDFVPTILDYFEVPISKNLEGKSMLPSVFNKKEEINEVVYTEWTRYEVDHDSFGGLQMMRAIVSKDFKLVLNLMDLDEFYDLKNDPYEVKNQINNPLYQENRNKLHHLLLQHMNDTRDPYRGYQWEMRSWRPEKVARWKNSGFTRQKYPEKGQERELHYGTGLPLKDNEFIRKN